MLEYHVRANDRVLERCAELPPERLDEPDRFDRGTAMDTLRHMVDVDYSWRELCIGNDVGEAVIWDTVAMDDLDGVSRFWAQERTRLLDYVASLDEAALDAPIEVPYPPFTVARSIILVHVMNHGTSHRSELARYLTEHGLSPGDLDLI